jgi:peptidoglycan/LPS O-acetylase OafA/YrhL
MSDFHVFWNRVYTGTDTRLDSILFGSIMAIAVNPVIDRLDRITRRRCAIAAVIGVVVLIVSIAMRGELFRQTLRYTVQGVALFPIFVYVIRYSDSTVTRIMEWKVLTHIGDLSYSLYVVHYTVMFVVKIWVTTNPFLTLLITFTVSYIIAEFMRRYVELPSVRMRNRVLERTRANTVAQEASPAT